MKNEVLVFIVFYCHTYSVIKSQYWPSHEKASKYDQEIRHSQTTDLGRSGGGGGSP